MISVKYTVLGPFSVAALLLGCGGDDSSPSPGGAASNSGDSSDTSESSDANTGGGANTGSEGAVGDESSVVDEGAVGGEGAVECPAGTTSVRSTFDSIPSCTTYFNCIMEVACSTPSQTCDAYRQSLTGLYCAVEGTTLDEATIGQQCDTALLLRPQCTD